jgi:hypothetical protein
MTTFLIERHFGQITDEQLQAGGSTSKRVAAEQFPEIVWDRSYAVQTAEGLVTYCVYQAPTEQMVRDHAAAAGLPADKVIPVADVVGPANFA